MNKISSIRHAVVQRNNQPLNLRENQIVQGEITKIYPNNKAEIQIGNHKLIAEITTSLSVGKQYFFQVQASDHIQLKVLGEQHASNKTTKTDIEVLLQQLGLKVNKMNSTMIRQLTQDKIPFNQEQLSQAALLLSNATNKAEAIDMLKSMIARKLPITEAVFQAVQMNQTESLSKLMREVYDELSLIKRPTEADSTLIRHLETLMSRPNVNERPAFVQQIMQQINGSSGSLNALKSLGLVGMSITVEQWAQIADTTLTANDSAAEKIMRSERTVASSPLKLPTNQEEAELLRTILNSLLKNGGEIQRTASQLKMNFPGLQAGSLTTEQIIQAVDMLERELSPLLPKETVQMIQQAMQLSSASQQTTTQGQLTEHQQQVLFQMLDLFGKGNTFQELASMATSEARVSENQTSSMQQSVSVQFMNHLQNYMQLIGLNDEYELKMNMEQPMQMEAMKSEPSIKAMLLGMIQGQEHGVGNRAQALVHLINGMQMQTVTEVNNVLQASFMLPGEKLALNQDVYMQFEGRKDKSGKIDPDFCRILFVLDLANMKETMIDMNVQKRIVSVHVYNEQQEPPTLTSFRPMLKDALEKMDYQLSTIQWKPLYEQGASVDIPINKKGSYADDEKERYDFLI